MLKYSGQSFIIEIPARDLSDAEIESLEKAVWPRLQAKYPSLKKTTFKKFLTNSGFYTEVKSHKKLSGPSEDK